MISPSQRPLPDNKQQSQQTNIHAPDGFRTHDHSMRVAVDLRLRPRGYWDRPTTYLVVTNSATCFDLRLIHHRAVCKNFKGKINNLESQIKCLIIIVVNIIFLSLLLHHASCRFTNYHTTNKCTNCMSFIFKSLF